MSECIFICFHIEFVEFVSYRLVVWLRFICTIVEHAMHLVRVVNKKDDWPINCMFSKCLHTYVCHHSVSAYFFQMLPPDWDSR